ncbi:MAG: CRISPR-associated protein Cmr3 [Archaeoglobaceae archaeon]|nr:CRISPR-associated protein Cmr3 [Archaeoglobaceae archaeon]
MQIAIKPVDVWLFRDGKPFNAKEDHIAGSIFPPSPFTLQGAIRTRVLVDKGVNPTEFARLGKPDPDVGYGDNFGKLRLCGPLLMRYKDGKWERLIPMPADVMEVALVCRSCGHKNPPKTKSCKKCGAEFVWSNDESTRPKVEFGLLHPEDLPFATNLPKGLKLLWMQTDHRIKEAEGWLPESEWMRYLQGQPPNQVVSSSELFTFEPRFGIAIGERGTTQEGMLYQAKFVRLKDDVALWAEVNGVQMTEKGFLRFGGEGKAATYEVIHPLPPIAQFNVKRFKVVLLTPAWFSGGWQPKDGDWSKIFNAPVRLIGAAIPRAQRFGGFDVAKKIPKPMRSFVPAGAVYFFEADEPITFADDFAFTETPDEVRQQNGGANAWAQIGLGVALIGLW